MQWAQARDPKDMEVWGKLVRKKVFNGSGGRSGSNGGKYDQNIFYILMIFKVHSPLLWSGTKGSQKTSSSTLLHQMTTGTKWSCCRSTQGHSWGTKVLVHRVRIQLKVIFILLVLMQVRVIISSISWLTESSAFILPSSPTFIHSAMKSSDSPQLSFNGSPRLSLFWSKISLLSPGCFVFPIAVVGLF